MKPKKPKPEYINYRTRRLDSALHKAMKRLALEHETTLEFVLNHVIGVGLEQLKRSGW